MVVNDRLALVSGLWLFPAGVGLGETSNVDLISCHIAGKQIEFSIVSAGVEAIWILTDKSHRVWWFSKSEGVAPVL